ncbi:hypothetical protein BD289DRAFT_368247, partial [Coniella lustricola]
FAVLSAIKKGERIFHYIFTITLLVGTIAYFAMASDLAWNVINQVNYANNGSRQIFFAKYVYWCVSFPAVVLALGLISGVSWATIFYGIFLAWTWILSYLFSAYTTSNYKWGFFAFGTFAWLLLAYETIFMSRRSIAARDLGNGVGMHHLGLSSWVNFLWLNYVIAYGISDGGNVIGVTPGFIYFGILDLLLVPIVAAAFMFLARRWDYGRMNIAFTQHGRVSYAPGNFPEKHTNSAPVGAPADGPVSDAPVAAPTVV